MPNLTNERERKRQKSHGLNWLGALAGGVVLLLRKIKQPNKPTRIQPNPQTINPGSNEDNNNRQFKLKILLAEYDALLREHELLQKMRQELGVYTLAATVALIGAFIGQIAVFTKPDYLVFFLIIPFFFTLMTWWYIRTNYSAALIEFYVSTKLRRQLSDLAGGPVLGWISFLYENEFSRTGKVMVRLQTLSRAGIIQGPAILSLLIFFLRKGGGWKTWSLIEYVLIISNWLGITISILLMFITNQLIWKIRDGNHARS